MDLIEVFKGFYRPADIPNSHRAHAAGLARFYRWGPRSGKIFSIRLILALAYRPGCNPAFDPKKCPP